LPHGNRVVRFSQSGELVHLATSVLGTERPNWPRDAGAAGRRPGIRRARNESSIISRRSAPPLRKPR
jgi:hypothetical protein